jgi:CSLREA domain-containing protein
MKVRVRPTVPALFLICFLAAINTSAATLVVTKTADTSDGVCDADCSLREAVTGAASGDIIVFSGLFNMPQTITLTEGQIAVTKNLTINGPGTVFLSVSGNNVGRILRISGGVTVNLSGMNFRDGRVGATIEESIGGAIRLDGSTNTLNLTDMEFMNNYAFNTQTNQGYGGAVGTVDSCTVNMDRVYMHDNTAPDGAAVRGRPGNLSIKNSIISNNTGEAVTGNMVTVRDTIFSRNSGTGVEGTQLTLTNSIVRGNGTGVGSATMIDKCIIEDNGFDFNDARGGGVINGSIGGVIRNTIIRNNKKRSGTGSGGGISTFRTLHVINSSIIQNTAANGGGIANSTEHLFVTNSTVSGNAAMGGTNPGLGGGIYSQVNAGGPNARITITNSTITNNVSSGKGGGIYHESTNEARIRNSIIAKNNSVLTAEKDISAAYLSRKA